MNYGKCILENFGTLSRNVPKGIEIEHNKALLEQLVAVSHL
jgi:hypothetical protein